MKDVKAIRVGDKIIVFINGKRETISKNGSPEVFDMVLNFIRNDEVNKIENIFTSLENNLDEYLKEFFVIKNGFLYKKSNEEKKKELFSKAGAEELAPEFVFELGNVEVAEKERGKGLAHHLLNRLIGLRNSRAHTIYCSTNSDEVANMLRAYRFSAIGDENKKPYLLGLM